MRDIRDFYTEGYGCTKFVEHNQNSAASWATIYLLSLKRKLKYTRSEVQLYLHDGSKV